MGNRQDKERIKNNNNIINNDYQSDLNKNNLLHQSQIKNPNMTNNYNVGANYNECRNYQNTIFGTSNADKIFNDIPNNLQGDNTNSNAENGNKNIDNSLNPSMPYLNKAYQIFTEGINLTKQFSFYEALFKFEEAQKITTFIYYKIIDDELLKTKVDYFLKNINSQIDFINFQIKNQFEYKDKAGFATREGDTKKVDYLESLRKSNYEISEISNGITYTIRDKTNDALQPKQISETDNSEKKNNRNNKTKNTNSNNQDNDTKIVPNDLKSKILSEIVDNKPGIKFCDVIGLDQAKQILKEIIVLPSIRPDLFTGLRTPPRGLLLFGPPGVGKTMIAKAVATECKCTFFNISASSLTSKYLGESEKLVRALFDLAFEKQPSVVFIDEIESILSKRSDGENDATKRLKTEFLVQFDGVGSDQTAKILIIGATNRPHELDPAVLRRLPKRIYIGPFDTNERKSFLMAVMKNNENNIKEDDFQNIANLTNFYSNSDLKELCREAAYEPIREISDILDINKINKLRATNYEDFVKANKKVRGTLNSNMLVELDNWNQLYGAIN